MKKFTSITPEELDPVFDRIGKDWMLISAADGDRANTMTASWGGLGVLWNRPVAFCFIRPERFTCPMVEASTHLTLSFLPSVYREALSYCGSHSGREGDKFAAAGLTCVRTEGGVPYPEQAELVLVCRKLYADRLSADSFCDPAIKERFYGQAGGLHRLFICEIEQVLREV